MALAQSSAMWNTDTAFARTKIQPPRQRADFIDRANLQAQIANALEHKRLTLLLAPAGWGKTSALARQLARLPKDTSLAWVSADEDDDAPRLLAALAAALEPFDLAWQVSPKALGTLALGSRGLRQAAREVANALAEAEIKRGLLIFDDVHRLTDPNIFEFFSTLIDWLPAHWGLVLASRTEPPLPLARWRARGELAEFGQNDLRFTTEEVAALLNARGHSADTAAELCQSTAGWAAGLSLMLSVGAKATSVAGRQHVFDFLADEVLVGMPERLRLFLLRCAVLPEITPTRCAYVSAMPDAMQCFEQIEREGLFVTVLDEGLRTLRLHDLFRDFLEDRLQRDHAAELPTLLRRAAEHEGDLVRAVQWLARAGAWDIAATALATRGLAWVSQGGGAAIERLLGLFPPESFERNPGLEMLRGMCAYFCLEFERASEAMQRVANKFEREGLAGQASRVRTYQYMADFNCGRHEVSAQGMWRLHHLKLGGVPGALAAYYSGWMHYAMQRPEATAGCIDSALAQLERTNEREGWQELFLMVFLSSLPGMGPVLQRFVQGAAAAAGERASLLRLEVIQVRAAIALRAGQVVEAREWLASADEELNWLGRPSSSLSEITMLHFALDSLVGDSNACRQAAASIRADMLNSAIAHQRTHFGTTLLCELRSAWALGDDDWVRAVAAERHQVANAYEWDIGALECSIASGLVAFLDARYAEAEALLMPPQGAIERLPMLAGGHAVMVCAEAQRRQGRVDAAAALLTRWFDSIDAGEPVGGALLAGPAVLAAVAGVSWGQRLAPARQQLLRNLAAQALSLRGGDATAVPPPQATHLPAGLTEREAEVLDLLAQGQSNKLIARELDLSPFTVKRHVANILNKTATTSRTEVATWWVAQRG